MPILLLALFGFAPTDQGLPVGPPDQGAPLDRALDLRMGSAGAAADFRARWGRQVIHWDPRGVTPRMVLGEGVPLADVDAMVADLARLAGVDPADLERLADSGPQERLGAHYAQTWRGAEVVGAGVDAWSRLGRVGLSTARLHRVRLDPGLGEPRPGEVVLPLTGADGRFVYHLVTRAEEGDEVAFYDRDGDEVHRYTTRRHLEVRLQERTVGDSLVDQPARGVLVRDVTGVGETTADDGSHSLGSPVDARLEGPYLTVYRDRQVVEAFGVGDERLDGGVDISQAAATSLHHFHVVRDWLADRRPDHPWLPANVPDTVDITSGSCNAYYTGGTINFYVDDPGRCTNFGEIADVVYHEYGHGVHDYIREGGTFASDVSEGSADYLSATILDDPVLAPNATPDGGYIRELDTDRRYPDDANGQVHNDGLIWGSFLWNLREEAAAADGEDGVAWVDGLFLETLSYGPTLTEIYSPVLMADDDDGDLANGTPNDCELLEKLNHHGIGPGAMGLVVLEHEPVAVRGSRDRGYPVEFSLLDITAGCGGFDPDSARVYYAVDPPADATLEAIDFRPLEATRDGERYTATVPRQLPGARVVYYLEWATLDGSEVEVSHGGAPRGLYELRVGDRRELWCEDFESGWGEWSHGAGLPDGSTSEGWRSEWYIGPPEGDGVYTPDAAWGGEGALMTNPQGAYGNNNAQYAMSPELAVEGAHAGMLLLTSRRWLTVEDAYYDQAQIRVDWLGEDGRLWQNYASPGQDGADEHTLDTGWVVHDLDLRALLSEAADADDQSRPAPPFESLDSPRLRFAWTLETDQGLEFGGWALDEVCVVTLDAEKTWRVDDLSASDDAPELSVTWTNPYTATLEATALVRRSDRWPESYEDGVIVDLDLEPEPGAAREVVDADARPGETFYYAVFTSEQRDVFFSEVVEGENADTGAVPGDADAPPEDTDEPLAGDSDSPREDDEAAAPEDAPAYALEPACACTSTGRGGGLTPLLALLALAVARRRGRARRDRTG